MTGLVLCGGASRRMGTDKAELALDGRTLLERAVGALDALCDEVVLAVGPEPRYAELGRPTVLDRLPDAGPLAGLEAGLGRARHDWVAALACDMPYADARVLEALLKRAAERSLDACLFESRTGPEPLCGVYARRCRASVTAALDAGERRVLAFADRPLAAEDGGRPPALGWLREDELAPELRALDSALNVNTPPDLERARRRVPAPSATTPGGATPDVTTPGEPGENDPR